MLRHVYPAADIPVVELSIDERKLASFHFEIGKKLAPLREEGVLAPVYELAQSFSRKSF